MSLTVLAFHRVIRRSGFHWPAYAELGIACTRSALRTMVQDCLLSYQPILLDDALRLPRAELDSRPYVSLTFDDGFKEHVELSEDLRSFGIPSTFFIVTSVVDNPTLVRPLDFYYHLRNSYYSSGRALVDLENGLIERMHISVGNRSPNTAIRMELRKWRWEEAAAQLQFLAQFFGVACECAELHSALYCDRHDIETLTQNGMRVGAHTVTHRALASLTACEQEWEITHSISQLRSLTGINEMPFCYPFGGTSSYSKLTASLVERSGASCACTSVAGVNNSDLNAYEIKRIDASSGMIAV